MNHAGFKINNFLKTKQVPEQPDSQFGGAASPVLELVLFLRMIDIIPLIDKKKEAVRMKIYYETNKEKIAARNKAYRKANKKKFIIREKAYREINKKKIKAYRETNKEKQVVYNKIYRKANKEKFSTYAKKYIINPKLRLSRYISYGIYRSLKNGNGKNGKHWETLVPYNLNDLIKRLKKTLPVGYKWEDYINGKTDLHIDHIIPISVHNFNSYTDTDFQRCWALKNLRLLPAQDNQIKHAKLTKHFQPSLLL